MNKRIIKFGNNDIVRVKHFWKWDKGQEIIFADIEDGTEVQFDNGIITIINNKRISVPDVIFEKSGERQLWIRVIGENHETTVKTVLFNVYSKSKPNDYVEPENEQSFREELQQMINNMGAPDADTINEIITQYLEEHPISAGITLTDVANYITEHKAELKGDKGEKGDKGDKGDTGEAGANGTNGYTPQKGVDYFDGADGQNGSNGTNYTITDADYDAIATVVLGKLENAEDINV